MVESNIVCEISQQRHRNAVLWRNLWTILTFIFGTTVVVFLVIAIAFYIRADWLPGVVSTLGTIVNGVAISWVTSRRAEAVNEEKEAFEQVKINCKDEIVIFAEEFASRMYLIDKIR